MDVRRRSSIHRQDGEAGCVAVTQNTLANGCDTCRIRKAGKREGQTIELEGRVFTFDDTGRCINGDIIVVQVASCEFIPYSDVLSALIGEIHSETIAISAA